MTVTNSKTEVLVVGAGPTGLVLALWLTRFGINVRIVDKADKPGTTSRALAVHARTLELYHQIDLAAGFTTVLDMDSRGGYNTVDIRDHPADGQDSANDRPADAGEKAGPRRRLVGERHGPRDGRGFEERRHGQSLTRSG